MDLGAYCNIEDLGSVAKTNNIEINRVRGYRLMKDETPITVDELSTIIDDMITEAIKEELCTIYEYGLAMRSYAKENSKRYNKYIKNDTVVWDNIHGKLRKRLKHLKKIISQDIHNQWDMWNKYCGKNVLYIHAKQGRTNWSDTWHKTYEKEPWYLDSCDDAYDPCYSDIYAQIKED